jgi:hypothetical protein
MSLLGKSALAMVIPAAGALIVTAAGTAHAAGDLYGAISVSVFRVGEATDYPTPFAADQAAMEVCGDGVGCRIVARIHNECGSVVERDGRTPFGTAPMYFTGTGATAAEAEQDARRIAGPDLGTPLLEITKPAFVLDTICTSNAG